MMLCSPGWHNEDIPNSASNATVKACARSEARVCLCPQGIICGYGPGCTVNIESGLVWFKDLQVLRKVREANFLRLKKCVLYFWHKVLPESLTLHIDCVLPMLTFQVTGQIFHPTINCMTPLSVTQSLIAPCWNTYGKETIISYPG